MEAPAVSGKRGPLGEFAIDKDIVSLIAKDHPSALFIPTASGDSPEYWQSFQEVYGQELGCETGVLYLLGVSPTAEELEKKVLDSIKSGTESLQRTDLHDRLACC